MRWSTTACGKPSITTATICGGGWCDERRSGGLSGQPSPCDLPHPDPAEERGGLWPGPGLFGVAGRIFTAQPPVNGPHPGPGSHGKTAPGALLAPLLKHREALGDMPPPGGWGGGPLRESVVRKACKTG